MKVESTGTINGAPNRTIETYVRLTPNYGGFGAAILAINGTIDHEQLHSDRQQRERRDIYVLNGNLGVTNGMTLYGNVYVPTGSIDLGNNTIVKGSIWARDTVTVDNPATVEGAALSSTGNITGQASSTTTPPPRATWSPPTSRSGASSPSS